MSPIRKEGDFRSVEIESWDKYVQEEIAEGIARGDYDNLPHAGKPIKIWQTDINPEYDLAFSRLKNAGVMPMWMELDKEIGDLQAALWSRLDATEALIRRLVAQMKAPDAASDESPPATLWDRIRRWFGGGFGEEEPQRPTATSIMATREIERERFLVQAAELDKKIVSYHDCLPRGGEHLQRLRWLPSRAERVFDDRINLSKWWEEAGND